MEHAPEDSGSPIVRWSDGERERSAPWQSVTGVRPPRHVELVGADLKLDDALRRASQGIGMLWNGPFGDARRLLNGLQRRLDRRPTQLPSDPAQAFYRYRQGRRNRARLLGMLLLRMDADGNVAVPGAPDVRTACRAAYGTVPSDCVLSLRELLGVLSAHEWRRRGVYVAALDARLHPHYGVFSPTRDEYVDLVAKAPMPRTDVALDLGTGTGVLAAMLAKRGVRRVVAVDESPRAVTCARENMCRLGLSERVAVRQEDLFPSMRADLVVCNPPWIPAAPASPLDRTVFDRDGRMLTGFIDGLAGHLTAEGQGWLVISDFAELLGLRTRSALLTHIERAGLSIVDRAETAPRHPRARDRDDPLAELRAAERVSLWRLRRAG